MNFIEKYFVARSERVNGDGGCKQTFTKDFYQLSFGNKHNRKVITT